MQNWKKTILTFMISQTVSLLGSMLIMYTIMWYVTLSTQSGIMITIMALCNFIPQLLISPFAGVWADRLNRKRLMIIADLSIAFVTLVIAILFMMDITAIWIIFIVSIFRSLGQAVHQPAVAAAYQQIVPEDKLIKIQGINQGIMSSSLVVMPILAGLLLTTVSIQYIFMIDVVTAVFATIILLRFVALPKHKAEENNVQINYFEDIKKGLQYVSKHSFISKLLLFGFLFMILAAAPSFLTYLQVARVFGDEAWRLAALETAFGIGMVIGSIIVSTWGGFKNRLLTYFIAYIAFGLGAIGLGIPFNFFVYISMWSIMGLFISLSHPLFVGLIQEKVDREYIGRVFSLFGVMSTLSIPLGMLVFGPLADVIDVSLIILFSGVGMVIIAIVPLFNKKLLKEGLKIEKPKENEGSI